MFDRFTEGAIKSIMLAQEEGLRMGHNFVDSEQIMLGLIGEGAGFASRSLKLQGLHLKKARANVEQRIGRGDFIRAPWWKSFLSGKVEPMPFKPGGKRVAELAYDQSAILDQQEVSTDHLWLGIFLESEESRANSGHINIATQVLIDSGIDINAFRDQILERLANK